MVYMVLTILHINSRKGEQLAGINETVRFHEELTIISSAAVQQGHVLRMIELSSKDQYLYI